MQTLINGKKLAVAAMIAASWLAIELGQAAQALTFTEDGDAGQTIGTAQAVGSNVNVIQGSIVPNNDADLFSFIWAGGDFTATVGSSFDPILSLFNSTGGLLAQNDDFFGFQSFISLNGLAQGQYLLGMASYPNFAADGPTFNTVGIGSSGGSYSITLNQPTTAIPTPALLPGLIGLGVAALRKRKAEAAEQANEA